MTRSPQRRKPRYVVFQFYRHHRATLRPILLLRSSKNSDEIRYFWALTLDTGFKQSNLKSGRSLRNGKLLQRIRFVNSVNDDDISAHCFHCSPLLPWETRIMYEQTQPLKSNLILPLLCSQFINQDKTHIARLPLNDSLPHFSPFPLFSLPSISVSCWLLGCD